MSEDELADYNFNLVIQLMEYFLPNWYIKFPRVRKYACVSYTKRRITIGINWLYKSTGSFLDALGHEMSHCLAFEETKHGGHRNPVFIRWCNYFRSFHKGRSKHWRLLKND